MEVWHKRKAENDEEDEDKAVVMVGGDLSRKKSERKRGPCHFESPLQSR